MTNRPKRGGRRHKVNIREVVNGIMYVLTTSCQWHYESLQQI